MKKFLIAVAATLALLGQTMAQTTNVAINTPTTNNGVLAIVAIMGQGATCTVASPCVYQFPDTFANWQKIGVWGGPLCQAANPVGSPPVFTACTGFQIFGWVAKSLITGLIGNANNYANQQGTANAIVVTPLPTPMVPTTPSGIPNCGGTC